MKKLNLLSVVTVMVFTLIASSCTNQKMVSCPDYKDDKSVIAKNHKAYKPQQYKASNKTTRIKKAKFAKVSETTLAMNKQNGQQEATLIKKESKETAVDALAISGKNAAFPKNRTTVVTETPTLAMAKKEAISVESLENEINAYELEAKALPASKNVVTETAFASNEVSEISDQQSESNIIAPIVAKPSKKAKKGRLRATINAIKSIKTAYATKPAISMAVASLVCSLIGLLIFGIPLGILSIVFGSVALGRIKIEPVQPGKGMAIAGIILGIVDIIGVFLILTM